MPHNHKVREWLSGTELRDALPPLRHGPERLGKRAGQVVEALLRAGGAATLNDLCAATSIRRDNFKRRYLRRLEEASIVAVEGEQVFLTRDWQTRLEEAREIGSELEAERADRRRYEAEREAFRQRLREEGEQDAD